MKRDLAQRATAINSVLSRYALSGSLDPKGLVKPIQVSLDSLYPPFIESAQKQGWMGDYWLQAEFLKYLYTEGNHHRIIGKNGELKSLFSVGRTLGNSHFEDPLGPEKPAAVMVITPKMVSINYGAETPEELEEDSEELYPFTPGIRDYFMRLAASVGFKRKEAAKWYVTSMLKFCIPGDTTLSAEWINGHIPWLYQEIALVRPKYIVCVGDKVLKKMLSPSATLTKTNGVLTPACIVLPSGEGIHFKVIGIPAMGYTVDFEQEGYIKRQLNLIHKDIYPEDSEMVNHTLAADKESLQISINEIKRKAKKDPKYRIIAVDLEWEGECPEQEGAHVLTVQFSAHPGEATVVPLYNSKGEVAFKEGVDVAVKLLESLFTEQPDWKPRLGGHFLRADLPWLLSLGISEMGLKHAYQPADSPEKCRDEGGWDTGLAYHAYRDDEEVKEGYGLKALAMSVCGLERYDTDLLKAYNDYASMRVPRLEAEQKVAQAELELQEAKSLYKTKKAKEENKALLDTLTENLKQRKKELKELPKKIKPKGFGCIPDMILYKYAAWDADATRRLIDICFYGDDTRAPLLDDDGYGNSSWEPFWRAHRASWGFGEMERTGFLLDVERLRALSTLFTDAYNAMLENFRDSINWPEFNPNSSDQRRGLLFGREMSKKKDGTYSMPEDAISFDLEPIRSTEKEEWKDLEDDELVTSTASTDSLTMSILACAHPEVRMFKDICKLGRTLAGNIRPMVPVKSPSGETVMTWEKGIYTYMRPDGTVHTRLSQTKKTGRASSSDPPMQNIGKSAEAILQNTLGYKDNKEVIPSNYPEIFPEPMYKFPCRTILRARPGNVLIESDFTGAELAVMAWASGDKNMIEHVRRNALPEDDPDFYDIHSHIAVKAFHLNCEPTKKGLASIHKKHLRVAAKAVVFGIPLVADLAVINP